MSPNAAHIFHSRRLSRSADRPDRRPQEHDDARYSRQGGHVVSTTNRERQGWAWSSDIIWVLVYSTLLTVFMLSWVTIPT
jgi:hypothetical protein